MAHAPRVLQVNVSRGGIPKLPVEQAWVSRLGVQGDAHSEPTVHGGPHRAVCLFGIEAIERLQAEGHPIEPGGAGENLTTLGVEWSTLPVGTRARVGGRLLLELASPTTPCSTQKPNFLGGRFSRISIGQHPSDSRMYARVLDEGPVRPGDPIEVLPPPPDSRAADELLLDRLDRAETKSSVAAWRAAEAGGFDVRITEDGELAMAASPAITGPPFNHASGLARLPNLVRQATEFYDRHACAGWLVMEAAPWTGAQPSLELAIYAAEPTAVAAAGLPDGIELHAIESGEAQRVESIFERAGAKGPSADPDAPNPWPAVIAGLAAMRHRLILLAEIRGIPVATAAVHFYHSTGWLRGMAVVPEARGRGIQRALIGERVRLAVEAGCDLVGASAEPGSVSARNLERMGFRRVGVRRHYRYQPAGSA